MSKWVDFFSAEMDILVLKWIFQVLTGFPPEQWSKHLKELYGCEVLEEHNTGLESMSPCLPGGPLFFVELLNSLGKV